MEKYQDKSLSPKERARLLVEQMTTQECTRQMLFEADALERLGIKKYNWWNEALHGVARAGMATVFPQAIGLAATFDAEMIYKMAEVISEEGRAKFNEFQKYEDYGIYKGITFWSPNVNIFRDPRWGRGQETYGEDPYLTAQLGVAFVKGLQQEQDGVMKAAACAKHFAVHSGPEKKRHEFDAVATQQDLYETYLPAFKALCDAGVEGFMGAYNRTNGEPCCGSPTLLKSLLREQWGFDGYVTSDCWAIGDFHLFHKITAGPAESVAMALENGCDLNCGNLYGHLWDALDKGLITEEQIRTACRRLMTTRIKLGMLDAQTPYDTIPYEVVDCAEHKRLNYELAKRSLVLLKNDGVLPLCNDKIKNLAVIGPNADSVTALMGNYHGTTNRHYTVLEGIREAAPQLHIQYSKGSHLYEHKLEDPGYFGDCLSEVRSLCSRADAVVVVVGLDETVEGEEMVGKNISGDKETLLLPECQSALIDAACECGKPVILVCLSGSAIDFGYGGEAAAAILQGWYPGGEGGRAIADLLFGKFSPSGKLPVTFYHDDDELPDFEDYSMDGRTYKFFKGEPLYPFGFGLGYSRFAFRDLQVDRSTVKTGEALQTTVTVENQGAVEAEEVVQLYIRAHESSHRLPRHKLCGVQRVSLKPGEKITVRFSVSPEAIALIDENGAQVFELGAFTLFAGGCQPDEQSQTMYGSTCASASFELVASR